VSTHHSATATEIAPPSNPSEKIPLRRKIAYGFGALADNFIMNGFGALVMPIYNIGLKLDPVLLGIALALPRIVDAITDPIMGNISDNTRSRWGRRRPYILIGSLLTGLLLPFIWMPPVLTQHGMFTWLTLMGIIYFSTYTVFIIPYGALGYEITRDYDERTRLLAWPNYIGLLGSLSIPWLYSLALLPVFGGAVTGARWVSVILGLLIIGAGALPAICLREPKHVQNQEAIKLKDAILFTVRNRPFLLVLTANGIVLVGLATMASLGLYLNIYLVFDGDKAAAAKLTGISGTLYACLSYVSVMLATYISTHWGKRRAAEIGLSLAALGVASFWWTLTPAAPYLQLASTALISLGLQGCWMLFISMVGDVCDEDELATGLRREGIYSSVGGFSRKIAVAIAGLGTGVILNLCGFDAEVAETTGTPKAVLFALQLWFVIGQTAVLLAGIFIINRYPITRLRAQTTRAAIQARSLPSDS
jgi:GPH family glycoside/pentoside/hexuronide:cation symporter